jgi:hypothetical protein
MSVDVEGAPESVVVIRKKLFGPAFGILVLGVLLLASAYVWGHPGWVRVVGWGSVIFGIVEIILWRYRPVLWIAPWGIGHRRHVLGRKQEYPRDRITGWSEESSEVIIRVTGASNIKISPADLHMTDTHRLTSALREYGYEHFGFTYGGA